MSSQIEKIQELISKREEARLGGGVKAIEKQHAKANTQLAKELRCCSTKAASKNLICL